MNIELLAESLKPWMRVSTWHTTHPLDQQRFHKALSQAFTEHGNHLSYDEFKDAMCCLFEELNPDKNMVGYVNDIERYSSNAETIASYLMNIE